MTEWNNYWRILQWNRLSESRFEESEEVAKQCRTAWSQIVSIVPNHSQLPKEFLYPFRGYTRQDQNALDLFNDDRRIILCMSDLRDYLELMRIKNRA